MGAISKRFATYQRTGVMPTSAWEADRMLARAVRQQDEARTREQQAHADLKGKYMGNCNITACQQPGATWWNRGSMAWYCRSCAKDINRFPVEGMGKLCMDRTIYVNSPYDVMDV